MAKHQVKYFFVAVSFIPTSLSRKRMPLNTIVLQVILCLVKGTVFNLMHLLFVDAFILLPPTLPTLLSIWCRISAFITLFLSFWYSYCRGKRSSAIQTFIMKNFSKHLVYFMLIVPCMKVKWKHLERTQWSHLFQTLKNSNVTQHDHIFLILFESLSFLFLLKAKKWLNLYRLNCPAICRQVNPFMFKCSLQIGDLNKHTATWMNCSEWILQ